MATKKAFGATGGYTLGMTPAKKPMTPTPPKIGQPKKTPKPATPSMKGGPGGLKSKAVGGSANAATGATKVAFTQATPHDVAKFLTKFAFGNMGAVPKTGGGAPRMGDPLSSVADLPSPGISIPDINLEDFSPPPRSIMDELPDAKTLMTPVPRPTPANQNRFMSQGTADRHWGNNYAKDYAGTAQKAQRAIGQRGQSPLNQGQGFADLDAGFPAGPPPKPGFGAPGMKPPIAGAPKPGAPAALKPPGLPGGLPKPPGPAPGLPAPPAGGLAKTSKAKKKLRFDLSDPKQFGKAAAMGCKVVNHTRGKMEKRAGRG